MTIIYVSWKIFFASEQIWNSKFYHENCKYILYYIKNIHIVLSLKCYTLGYNIWQENSNAHM
jgi:hypothetical protein